MPLLRLKSNNAAHFLFKSCLFSIQTSSSLGQKQLIDKHKGHLVAFEKRKQLRKPYEAFLLLFLNTKATNSMYSMIASCLWTEEATIPFKKGNSVASFLQNSCFNLIYTKARPCRQLIHTPTNKLLLTTEPYLTTRGFHPSLSSKVPHRSCRGAGHEEVSHHSPCSSTTIIVWCRASRIFPNTSSVRSLSEEVLIHG